MVEIPRQDWAAYCRSFSEAHDGWLVRMTRTQTTLEEQDPLGAETGTAEIASGVALRGMACHEHGGSADIVFKLGSGDTYEATAVTSLQPLLSPEGEHVGLRLDLQHGQTLLLRFRVAMVPEMVDGVA